MGPVAAWRATMSTMVAILGRRRGVVVGLIAVLGPYFFALVLVPFRSSFSSSAAALCFLALITGVAILGDRRSGVLASLSSALWFDFYLTRPYDRFAISHRPDLETTICIVVVGLLVNELASQRRRSFARATKESDFVAGLYELALLVSDASSSEQLIARAAVALTDVLSLRDCTFERVASGHPYARILASGAVSHVGLAWPTKDIGLPGPNTEILALWHGHSVGRFVLTPTPGRPVSLERRRVAVTVASLVGCALAAERPEVTGHRVNSDT